MGRHCLPPCTLIVACIALLVKPCSDISTILEQLYYQMLIFARTAQGRRRALGNGVAYPEALQGRGGAVRAIAGHCGAMGKGYLYQSLGWQCLAQCLGAV